LNVRVESQRSNYFVAVATIPHRITPKTIGVDISINSKEISSNLDRVEYRGDNIHTIAAGAIVVNVLNAYHLQIIDCSTA